MRVLLSDCTNTYSNSTTRLSSPCDNLFLRSASPSPCVHALQSPITSSSSSSNSGTPKRYARPVAIVVQCKTRLLKTLNDEKQWLLDENTRLRALLSNTRHPPVSPSWAGAGAGSMNSRPSHQREEKDEREVARLQARVQQLRHEQTTHSTRVEVAASSEEGTSVREEQAVVRAGWALRMLDVLHAARVAHLHESLESKGMWERATDEAALVRGVSHRLASAMKDGEGVEGAVACGAGVVELGHRLKLAEINNERLKLMLHKEQSATALLSSQLDSLSHHHP